jgi:hypothetical protein
MQQMSPGRWKNPPKNWELTSRNQQKPGDNQQKSRRSHGFTILKWECNIHSKYEYQILFQDPYRWKDPSRKTSWLILGVLGFIEMFPSFPVWQWGAIGVPIIVILIIIISTPELSRRLVSWKVSEECIDIHWKQLTQCWEFPNLVIFNLSHSKSRCQNMYHFADLPTKTSTF